MQNDALMHREGLKGPAHHRVLVPVVKKSLNVLGTLTVVA